MTLPGPDPLPHYLPRLVRAWDVVAPGRLHLSVSGSMAFVDVSGFTDLSERLARHGNVGAEEITGVIDTTFDGLLRQAGVHGANLLAFGGDALLLLFEGPEHAVRAAASAHAMGARLSELGPFTTRAGDVSLQMSVGVHTGTFEMFLVGRSHRELLVAGPDVSRTVEMEGAAAPGQVLLSPETAADLPPDHRGRRVGPGVLLRGTPEADPTTSQPPPASGTDLARFVPTALRDILVAGSVEPEHRPATVAFLHVGGLDDLLATRGPTETAEVLDDLVAAVQQAADDHGVTFLASDVAADGAKVILATGVPQATGNDQERLLLALRQVLDQPHGLPVRAGVNTGHVFSGVVGSEMRRTYTVMGDVVNLAARLMAAAPPGELYASERVPAASRTTFTSTLLEPLTVKGKRDPVPAVAVGPVDGSRDGVAEDDLPLVGRDREVTALLEDWEQAVGGSPRIVRLAAPVGMGKSRVLREFLARAGPRRLLRAECRLYESATTYFPLRALLRDALGIDDADDPARALEDSVAERCPDLRPWLALLGEVAGLDLPPSREVLELDEQFRPTRTRAAVHAVLAATVTEPTVFLVEDTHWMDEGSRSLLAGLSRSVTDEPWLILLTARPGDTAEDTSTRWSRQHELRSLSDDDAATLVVAATADHPLLPDQVDAIVERGEGRPLFLLELLAALRRGGDAATLPDSVEQLVAARVDELARPDRNVLRRLAVLGRDFDIVHAAVVLAEDDTDADALHRRVGHLGRFLSVDDDGRTRFRNTTIRDVAYEGLPFRTRAELHARVGDSILADAGDNPESRAELLSVHYHRARRWEDSWTFSRVAGDTARSLFDNRDAATFYRRALAAGRRLDRDHHQLGRVSTRLGEVLERAGRFDDALEALRQGLRHAGDDGFQRAELLLCRAQVRTHKATYPQALRDTAVGLRLLADIEGDQATGLRARLLALRASVRMAQQRPRETLDTARDAVRAARAAGRDDALARAYGILDWAHFVLGEPDRATHSAEAVEIYESLGMFDRAADVVNNMGGFAYYLGDWNGAIEHVARSRDLSARAGNDVQAASTGVNLGELLVSQGRTTEAEPVLAEARRVLAAAGDRDGAINAELQMARLLLRRGDDDRAERLLESVRGDANELGQLQFAYEAVLYLAECRIRADASAEALELVERATARAGDQAAMFEPQRARVVGRALVDLGRHDEARDQLAVGLAAARELGLVYEEALLRVAQHELAIAVGDEPDPAERTAVANLLDDLGVTDTATAV